MRNFVLIFFLLLSVSLFSQNGQRVKLSLNNGWFFSMSDVKDGDRSTKWKAIKLPHTWNVKDVMDDEPGYYRGIGTYKKTLVIKSEWKGKEIFLYFEGANQVTEVFVNGKFAGSHVGGYTGFYVNITNHLRKDGSPNEILVKVNNAHDKHVPPLSADFSFYGGIYRDVYLLAVNPDHFTINEFHANDLFVQADVSKERAIVSLRGSIRSTGKAGDYKIRSRLFNQQNKLIKESFTEFAPAQGKEFFSQQFRVDNPTLWSPEHPYLYRLNVQLLSSTNEVLDEITHKLGMRWFRFDATHGFFLNDKSYKLIGTSRHQDYEGLGNAVPDKLAVEDLKLLKAMGANFLRIAHYPQDPVVLQTCDELGLLASVEIPVVNEITESHEFFLSCERMLKEMIHQNYNHSSVIIWCYMNEVFLRMPFPNDKERQNLYLEKTAELAKRLDSVCRQEDPSRYTMLVNHGDFNRYHNTGLTKIPMLVGWNLYSGWYGGSLSNFPAFLDQHHKLLPQKPLLVTEYGADADPRIHSFEPVRFDKSVEYTTAFHQYYFNEMMKRPFVAAAMIWNLADFNSETREESMPHINNKGLLKWNREAKDPYHYYTSQLSKQPYLKILGTKWNNRSLVADSFKKTVTVPLQISTNLDEAVLFVNNKHFGKESAQLGIISFQPPLADGRNNLRVTGIRNGKRISDSITLFIDLIPEHFFGNTKFHDINVLLGSRRYFVDDHSNTWIPDQPYRSGSFGSVGGKAFKIPGNTRLPYGTDKNIIGTESDPIYQTQNIGLSQYRFDVPPGEYRLVLHFAELTGSTAKGLPYNLSSDHNPADEVKRIFDVFVNDSVLLKNFDIAASYGIAKAVVKTFVITIKGRKGLRLDFKSIEGQPVLNAIQLSKIK